MVIEFDEVKDKQNRLKHKISLEAALLIDWQLADIIEDYRFDYGERRYIAYGNIGIRLFVCAFTIRNDIRRIISLRKATKQELRDHGQV